MSVFQTEKEPVGIGLLKREKGCPKTALQCGFVWRPLSNVRIKKCAAERRTKNARLRLIAKQIYKLNTQKNTYFLRANSLHFYQK